MIETEATGGVECDFEGEDTWMINEPLNQRIHGQPVYLVIYL
jgi:hypothetical protein